jgi:dynein light chain Tctex-type 1
LQKATFPLTFSLQNHILQSLIDKTATGEAKIPAYKYIANSTIIQHPGNPSEASTAGRRGMHSAVGAFWNTDKDGTFSYKWDGAEKKGMDVVISINWIGL